MAHIATSTNLTKNSLLTTSEKDTIEQKVRFEIAKGHYSMIKLGGIANIIGAAIYVWIFRNQNFHVELYAWYVAIVLTSLTDIFWASYFESGELTLEKLRTWRHGFLYILASICLTWGSMTILFLHGNLQYQMITLAFLLAVLICFSFSAVTDFTVAVISILCLLIPTIAYQLYHALEAFGVHAARTDSNIGISFCFLVLGIFLLVACYIGDKIVRNFFRLNFENIELTQKLEAVNKFLELRVKERTIELEKSLKVVTYQATHDLLTELPNQRLLSNDVNAEIENAFSNKHFFTLACVSINGLNKIYDGLGQQVGDLILQRVAKRFQSALVNYENKDKSAVQYTVTLSRQDVFVILMTPLHQPEEIEPNIEKIFALFQEAFYVGKEVIKLSVSIGVSSFPRDGQDYNALITNAEAARLMANKQGGNAWIEYKQKHNANTLKQLEIESNLNSAIKNDELLIEYQPFIDIKTSKICGVEALVRWNSAALGLIYPKDFISLAEANGTIIPIGEWILRHACAQTAELHAQGYTDLKVSVNLSAKQLQQKNLIQIVRNVLLETKLNPAYLELELTESEAFRGDAIKLLSDFKSLGLGLSIDDFGTGYSALSSLKLFEIDKIKIDKSFVDDIETSSDSRAIVANTILLGKKLKVAVIAEGVETIAQVKFLREQGCDMIQGYYFSPPVKLAKLIDLLSGKIIMKSSLN